MPFKDLEQAKEYRRRYYQSNKAKKLDYSKKYRETVVTSEISRGYYLKNKYNITEEDYIVLRAKQNNACAICNIQTKLHVDHDHETGQIRGLLCLKCNTALGTFGDSVEGLEVAINYLKAIK